MKNKEYHILYILHIPKLKAYKIGITEINRINNRVKEIERDFGKINKRKSCIYHSKSAKTIKNIEKGLHTIAWEYSKNIKKNGSGKTEFFNENIFPHTKKILKTISDMYQIEGPIYLNKNNNNKKFTYISSFLFLIIILFLYTIFKLNPHINW